jgi:hypothetical protein
VPDGVGKVRKVRVYTKPATLLKLDQRTREARLMRETRADLVKHVGGQPSATQRALIDRAVRLTLQLHLMDAKQADAPLTEHDGRTYLAWCNTLTRLMRQLGLEGAKASRPSLRDYLDGKAAAQ